MQVCLEPTYYVVSLLRAYCTIFSLHYLCISSACDNQKSMTPNKIMQNSQKIRCLYSFSRVILLVSLRRHTQTHKRWTSGRVGSSSETRYALHGPLLAASCAGHNSRSKSTCIHQTTLNSHATSRRPTTKML